MMYLDKKINECPICKKDPVIIKMEPYNDFLIRCDNHDCTASLLFKFSPILEAIEVWNRYFEIYESEAPPESLCCPFCGSKPWIKSWVSKGSIFRNNIIECRFDGCAVRPLASTSGENDFTRLLERWNKRPKNKK